MDTLPVVWELLLDDDQQLVSSAGKVLNTDQNDSVLFIFHLSRGRNSGFVIIYFAPWLVDKKNYCNFLNQSDAKFKFFLHFKDFACLNFLFLTP